MEYTHTRGLTVSKITLGTVQLGMKYGINNQDGQPSVEKANGILETAINGGINTFDTSSDYGTSEQVVGDYFKRVGGEKPLIVTKFGVKNTQNPLPFVEVEKKVREQVENSLTRLGYQKLPLLLVHDENDLLCYGESLAVILNRLKDENLIDKVGVSLNHFSCIEQVLKYDMYEAVQLPLNILDVKNATGSNIKKLAQNGVMVFIRSVYLQGLLFRNPQTLPQGVLQNAKESLERLQKIAEEENVTIAELALAYIRDLDGVSSLVMGADNPQQVKENIELINAKGLSARAREKIIGAFSDIDERVLSPWLWNK